MPKKKEKRGGFWMGCCFQNFIDYLNLRALSMCIKICSREVKWEACIINITLKHRVLSTLMLWHKLSSWRPGIDRNSVGFWWSRSPVFCYFLSPAEAGEGALSKMAAPLFLLQGPLGLALWDIDWASSFQETLRSSLSSQVLCLHGTMLSCPFNSIFSWCLGHSANLAGS